MKEFSSEPNNMIKRYLPFDKAQAGQGGFSLIELLVSLSLFIVVLTMSIGSLLVLINANAKAQNIQASVSNVQFALDSMAREIRTGYSYYCSTSASTDMTGGYTQNNDCDRGVYLSFIEGGESISGGASNSRIAYRYNGTDKTIERKVGSGSWIRLTDPTVVVETMYFNVNNSGTLEDDNSQLQANATIYIKGTVAGVSDTDAAFEIQTTVTKRVLDL